MSIYNIHDFYLKKNPVLNKGTLLKDPYKLLTGTVNLIRHVDVEMQSDYRNPKVRKLIEKRLILQ